MKLLTLLATAAVMFAAEPHRLTVRFIDNASVPFQVRAIACAMATRIYRDIGIHIEWTLGGRRNTDADAVTVELRSRTPESLFPGVMAYALPFEGEHVVVFYDRVRARDGVAQVLGHVMAHEIAHILQGIPRHSESGIMKWTWSQQDYGQMHLKPLAFTPHDIQLIEDGVSVRWGRLHANGER